MKVAVPNPEYAQAELEERYIFHPSIPPEVRPPVRRFRFKDSAEITRRRKANEPLTDLEVPSHILVEQ